MLLFGISFMSASAQMKNKNIVGTWQLGSEVLASGYKDHYCFKTDGSFYFGTDEFDGTRRILSFGGTYQIIDNVLVLRITYSKEIKGGIIERDETVGGSGWIINNGKIVNKKYKHPSVCNLELERQDSVNQEGTYSCILIDKQEFYKVDNPIEF